VEALHNLIENAVQHSRRGAEVRVTARPEVDHGAPAVTCCVDDDGPGFNAGDAQELFRPFFSRRTGGTGLGLSIAQRIVEEHGGRITAGNRPEGGARVALTISRARREHEGRRRHG
jgi:signal transduction histidine kinase